MNSPLNILHLEDNPLDAKLVELKLKNEQISCFITRVETQADFIAALEQGGVDLILSDFMLPHFDGMSALAITRARFPNVPFILLSGEMGEELAVQAIKGGATDFVVKGRLTLLTTAMRRAIKEIHERAERDSLQTQFVQSQKMQVFGQFAGGIAHDFNNILAVIIGYSDLMIHRIEPGSPLRAPAEEIRHAADRAAGLTRQLLTFSRKQSNQPVVLNLNDTLKNLEKMLRRLIHENIALSIHADQQIGNIKADAGQVGQVLMNLVVNARDAMPNGGALTLQTRNVTLDDAYVRSHPRVTPGRYVKLSVSDSGIGMPEHVKARLFEAFFTTKPEGKGTGLGLATCKNIVKQCDGHINVHSEPGKGATFEVYFPEVDQPASDAARTKPSGTLPRGKETVLLVEDEPSVCRLACDVLLGLGYTVLRASNGEEGLRVAREVKGAPVSLVVTDVVMPRMGGRIMAEWLKATDPNVKILYTSGYTEEAISQHGIQGPDMALLPKPYTPATLAHKVRELLDAPTA